MNKISVGIIYKNRFEPARLEAEKLEKWLFKRGISAFLEEMRPQVSMDCVEMESSLIRKGVDWVVVLGGDGTLLGAARKVGKK